MISSEAGAPRRMSGTSLSANRFGTRLAKPIRASGHVRRANRPDTRLLLISFVDTARKGLAMQEPSTQIIRDRDARGRNYADEVSRAAPEATILCIRNCDLLVRDAPFEFRRWRRESERARTPEDRVSNF